jgi:hypothetical protein
MTTGFEPRTTLGDGRQCVDVAALVPGDPDRMREVAARYRRIAEGCGLTSALLAALDTGDWQGGAADAFRALRQGLPVPFHDAERAFGESAAALEAVALEIDLARRTARRAVGLVQEAAGASEVWRRDGSVGPDPGDHDRAYAHTILHGAQQELQGVARHNAARIQGWADHPPGDGGLTRFAEGTKDSLVGTGALAWSLTGDGLVDGDRWQAAWAQLGVGVLGAARHPITTGEVALEAAAADPAHVVGGGVPGVLFAGATSTRLAAFLGREPEVVAPLGSGSPFMTPPLHLEKAKRFFANYTKGVTSNDRIGDGTTLAALHQELATGEPVGFPGATLLEHNHLEKAENEVRGITRLLRRRDLVPGDRTALETLRQSLEEGIALFPVPDVPALPLSAAEQARVLLGEWKVAEAGP